MTIETPILGKVMLCQTLSNISSVAQPIDQELILFSHQFMFKQKTLQKYLVSGTTFTTLSKWRKFVNLVYVGCQKRKVMNL